MTTRVDVASAALVIFCRALEVQAIRRLGNDYAVVIDAIEAVHRVMRRLPARHCLEEGMRLVEQLGRRGIRGPRRHRRRGLAGQSDRCDPALSRRAGGARSLLVARLGGHGA